MGKWRRHSREFKREAVARMKACANIEQLAQELGIERKLLYTWKYQFEGRPEKRRANYSERPVKGSAEARLRRENERLKQALGEKAAEVDFFVAALRRVNQHWQRDEQAGELASTPKSGRIGRKAN